MNVENRHLRLLHVARRQVGIEEDDWRALLMNVAGVESSKDLTLAQFNELVDALKRMGFESKPRLGAYLPKNPPTNPHDVPTPRQLGKLRALFVDAGIDTAARQQGLCRRVIKQPWPQTRTQATKVIQALKNMVKRRNEDR